MDAPQLPINDLLLLLGLKEATVFLLTRENGRLRAELDAMKAATEQANMPAKKKDK